MATNVLILGSGGREHALGWKLKQSKSCGKIFFGPGNGGTDAIGKNVELNADKVDTKTVDAIDYFCRHNKIDLVVIGPEDPLCGGMVDRLQRPGRYVFGPSKEAARLEGDKAYAKQLMRGAAIPTGEARVFTQYPAAVAYVESRETPVVVKAAGLAKGKGAIVTSSVEEATDALRRIMKDREFGNAGDQVLIEEKLTGQEVSVLALVDGRNIYRLDACQDHKQVGEGDTGPNTGGMGAYCPTPVVDEAALSEIDRRVLVPTVDAMRRSGTEFKGVLYAGLMLTPAGPKVLEFNTRFGDPETQPLMVRMKGDLLEAMIATCEGRLGEVELDWDKRVACCVVMASGGYPGSYEKNKAITGIDDAEAEPGVHVFHAGTTRTNDGTLVTAGGRVLGVTALGDDLAAARDKANAACEKIRFDGAYFRRDIGHRVMQGAK
ncbi:MAG: phosphoribosylamine--glycine ligase [Phycisphaeraceae bacterium]